MSDRKQYVNIDNCKSQTEPMSNGTPRAQYWPLLFLLLINDLPRIIITNLSEYIEFQNYKIQRTPHVNYLGVNIDKHLTWDTHIKELCNKLKILFHVFYNIKELLSIGSIKTIYYTLI